MIEATPLASTITLMEITGVAHKLISSFRAISILLRRVHLSDDQLHSDGHIPAHRAMGRAGLSADLNLRALVIRVFVADGEAGRAGKNPLRRAQVAARALAAAPSMSTAHHIATKRSTRATAPRTAHLRFHQGLPEDVVDLVHQQPGAPVGHAHLLARGRDGAMLGDELHQGDLARAQVAERPEIDAYGQGGRAKVAAVRNHTPVLSLGYRIAVC
jgi:hypothetical protein